MGSDSNPARIRRSPHSTLVPSPQPPSMQGPNVTRVCFHGHLRHSGRRHTTVRGHRRPRHAAPDRHPARPTNSSGRLLQLLGQRPAARASPPSNAALDRRRLVPPAPRPRNTRPRRRLPQLRSARQGPGRQHRRHARRASPGRSTPPRPTPRSPPNPADPRARPTPVSPSRARDSGGSGVASFECRLDSLQRRRWAACSSPKRPTPRLADGSHTFEVRADDQPATSTRPRRASPGRSTPPRPTHHDRPATRPERSSSADASFSFSRHDGGSGVATFECRLDAGALAACTSPKDYTGLADGSHTFEVRAKDQAGNIDATPASFTWTIDTTAPRHADLTQPGRARRAATGASFSFSGSDGGSGVASFECRLDSRQAFAACASPKEYSGLADGSHTSRSAPRTRPATLDATPASFTWTIDTTAPDTQITAHPAALSRLERCLLQLLGQRRRLGRRLVRMPGSTPDPWPPAPRRRNTPASPTAPTPSKCAPRTRPATSTPPRRASPGRSTPPRPTPRSPPSRRLDQLRGRLVRIQWRLQRRLLRMPARRRRLGILHLAEAIQRPRRRPHTFKCAQPTPPATRTPPRPCSPGRRHQAAGDPDRRPPD